MKVKLFTENRREGSDFYRGSGAFSEIHKIDNTIDVSYLQSSGYDIAELKGADIVVLTRPFTNKYLEISDMCTLFNIPFIVDFDDDFLEIPEDNQFRVINDVSHPNWKNNFLTIVKNANAVMVSTKSLQEKYFKYNSQIFHVPNCFDDYMFRYSETYNFNKRILWRGGRSHKNDLKAYKNEIIKLVKDNPDFEFVFWGNPKGFPAYLYSVDMESVKFLPYTNIYDYFLKYQQVVPSLVIVPLEFTEFNKGKSDISKLEAVANGAMAICPDMIDWRWSNESDGVYYKNNDDFLNLTNFTIDRIRNMDAYLVEQFEIRKDHLRKNRLLSKSNHTRIQILKGCL